ncbi:MAG: hypothetical protein IKJ36_01980 [Clostridia bacterium]|nr:hypothetical protein [Clostridia bacterium]
MWRFNKFKISKDVKRLLKIHFKKEYEVGGVVFAKNKFFYTEIETLSFKKGAPLTITFNKEDTSLFEIPKGNFIVGTWHTHPFQKEVNASSIDLNQWKKWNKKFIHLIYNGEKLKIYTSKGGLISVEKI